MTKTIYFLNQKYTCSKNCVISTHHFRNRKHIGVVKLGREQRQVFVCLCGCRIYNCDDKLFTIKIDDEEIDGRVCKHFFLSTERYNLIKEHLADVGLFYGCTKTLEQLK